MITITFFPFLLNRMAAFSSVCRTADASIELTPSLMVPILMTDITVSAMQPYSPTMRRTTDIFFRSNTISPARAASTAMFSRIAPILPAVKTSYRSSDDTIPYPFPKNAWFTAAHAAKTVMISVYLFRAFGESSRPYTTPQIINVPAAVSMDLTRYRTGSE